MKRIIAIITVLVMAAALFVGCGQGSANVSSLSGTEGSEIASTNSEKESSSTNKTSSVVSETSSVTSKRPLRGESGETESSSIKVYNNPQTIGLAGYHSQLKYCTSNGSTTDAKIEEFTTLVNSGYFNTWFVSLNADALTQAKIIAEAGGTIWIAVGQFYSSKTSIEKFMENVDYYMNLLKDAGYGEIINGFSWDEPVYQGMTNADFLLMTKSLYQAYGLRNFPVFATGEFSGLEGNQDAIGTEADDMNKVLTSSLVYVTDVAFDAYGVDVRDGVTPTEETLARWREKISPKVNSSKDYYTEFKNKLLNHVGHQANVWYYPCAYEAPVGTGLGGIKKADEGYCLGHLEFMAEEILNEDYPGGLVLYTYHTSGERFGLQRHVSIKGKDGRYKYYPDEEKWDTYFDTLKYICTKFSSNKIKFADITKKN